jgi:predicted DNA-binding helix-hairpin-helix protein
MLLRVPGIGLKAADTILRARCHGKIRDVSYLKKLGILTERAAPFLLLDGHRVTYQPILFQT